MRKTTKTVNTVISDADAEELMHQYTLASIRHKQICVEIDTKVTAIRKKYSQEMLDEEKEMADILPQLEQYAKTADMAGRKSLDLNHGVIGFRTDPPSLKTLKGFKWDDVLQKVKKYLPDFVRTKEEIDKKDLLANRNEVEIAKHFDKCGIEVIQDEKFFIEPKTEA